MKNNNLMILIWCCLFFVNTNLSAQELKASETHVLINISVTNMKSAPMPGEKVIIVGQKTKKQFETVTDKLGKSKILIPKGDIYDVNYKDLVEIQNYSSIDVPKDPGLFAYDLILQFQPAETIVLKNVLFDTGKASLKKESYPALNDLFEVLDFKKTTVIEIAGHNDNVGSPETNIKLPKDSSAQISTDGLLGGKVIALVPGGDDAMLKDGGEITITQSAASLV